jgi:enterobacterial common antigen flippase
MKKIRVKNKESESYGQIAKSTGIFGGFQLANIFLGLIRTKVLAILLGTAGVGLAGLYQSVIDFIKTVAGMGLSFSSVKEIAQASESGDKTKIAQTITVLRRLLWWTGLAGMFLMMFLSIPASIYLFGDKSKALPICILSFAVFTGILSSGQIALLQGTRQILKMAKASLYGAFGGFVVSVVFYAWLGIEGVVPALIGVSIINLFFSWWFSHKEFVLKVEISAKETIKNGGAMVKLGFFTMLSGMVSTLTLFLMKSFIIQTENLEVVGLYQAVWSISFIYLGAILTSMGADYYPKLCGLNGDNAEMVRFSNEQTRFVVLVSSPVIIGVLLLSVPILQLLYSSKFVEAADLMRWQIFGTYLKVIVWPVGFFLLAKNKGLRFFIVEFVWFAIYYLVTRFTWKYFGLESAGIAYFVAYIIYFPLVFYMVKPLCGFRYNNVNVLYILFFLAMTIIALIISMFMKGWFCIISGSLIFLISSAVSLRGLNNILPLRIWLEKLKKRVIK